MSRFVLTCPGDPDGGQCPFTADGATLSSARRTMRGHALRSHVLVFDREDKPLRRVSRRSWPRDGWHSGGYSQVLRIVGGWTSSSYRVFWRSSGWMTLRLALSRAYRPVTAACPGSHSLRARCRTCRLVSHRRRSLRTLEPMSPLPWCPWSSRIPCSLHREGTRRPGWWTSSWKT